MSNREAAFADRPEGAFANDLGDGSRVEPLPGLRGNAKSALNQDGTFGFVMDVPVELRVELGRRKSRIGDLLRLGAGSILELDKPNGEPLDLYVNDRLIARGEAVVVGERYGIRITEVLISNDGPGSEK
jgi:flagellar motor switch protein FliN/FliY